MANLYLEENRIMDNYTKSRDKKTRQGSSNNTKYGNKGSKKDKTDALMRSFDTSIEAKSYIQGCIDSVVTFTKDADEDELLKQFEIKDATKEIWL